MDPRLDLRAELKRDHHEKEKKPLKKARSEAELTRVRQGWTLIVLSSINVTIGLLLLAYQIGIL